MSKRDLPSTTDPEPRELPPIPDGGLGKGLPSWLETPPSRPVKPAGEPTPIDLGALAAGAQLPQWLQDLSDRVAQNGTPEEDAVPVELEEEDVTAPVATEPSSEPVPEPPAIVALPVEQTPAETIQPVVVTPEPRQIGVYLLYALAVIVIAGLAAWLIWA